MRRSTATVSFEASRYSQCSSARAQALRPSRTSPGTTPGPSPPRGALTANVASPHHTLDIQIAREYLVHTIRTMHGMAGRRIAVLGHSQACPCAGPWRFWPDTRTMLDDIIGMAPPNQGTTAATALCREGLTSCTPALVAAGCGHRRAHASCCCVRRTKALPADVARRLHPRRQGWQRNRPRNPVALRWPRPGPTGGATSVKLRRSNPLQAAP
jgi:hypothetical protein